MTSIPPHTPRRSEGGERHGERLIGHLRRFGAQPGMLVRVRDDRTDYVGCRTGVGTVVVDSRTPPRGFPHVCCARRAHASCLLYSIGTASTIRIDQPPCRTQLLNSGSDGYNPNALVCALGNVLGEISRQPRVSRHRRVSYE